MQAKIQWKKLIPCVLLPLVVGGLSALLTRNGMEKFAHLEQPPLSPPGWLFPVVWTILFFLMGVASYLVVRSEAPWEQKKKALILYGVQLVVNFFWSILFFDLGMHLFAFFWLVLLWGLILAILVLFGRIRPLAGRLLVPYLLWVTFAGYLNFGIFLLNRV